MKIEAYSTLPDPFAPPPSFCRVLEKKNLVWNKWQKSSQKHVKFWKSSKKYEGLIASYIYIRIVNPVEHVEVIYVIQVYICLKYVISWFVSFFLPECLGLSATQNDFVSKTILIIYANKKVLFLPKFL